MHPSIHARANPGRPALIAPGEETVSFGALDGRSNQSARLFRSLNLLPGNVIAIALDNCPAFLEIVWGAQRAGLYFVCVSTKLNAEEALYILRDSGASLVVVQESNHQLIDRIGAELPEIALFTLGAGSGGGRDFVRSMALMPDGRIPDEQAGYDMLYSSGTTGLPKGIRPRPISGEPIDVPDATTQVAARLYEIGPDTVYLCPAPLYHAAPLRWTMAMQRLGASVVLMDRFDPQEVLGLIERFRVTMAQFVPTHFVRMLKLPEAVRRAHDLSSLRTVIHAAAPCPVPVKEAMIEWLGPIVHEYYSGSEGVSATFIGPEDWLMHKGSVGRPLTGSLHICDEQGKELPAGSEGLVYFSGGGSFEYHNDPAKTADARNAQGWVTLGDIGRLDGDGFLYLTDRKSMMIISGGVNIYPQEIENLLITHPRVADVAVLGGPDEEMGEKVIAIIQPLDWADAGPALIQELDAFARANLSHVKIPRQYDFIPELPRHPTGKLLKRLLRDRYRQEMIGMR